MNNKMERQAARIVRWARLFLLLSAMLAVISFVREIWVLGFILVALAIVNALLILIVQHEQRQWV